MDAGAEELVASRLAVGRDFDNVSMWADKNDVDRECHAPHPEGHGLGSVEHEKCGLFRLERSESLEPPGPRLVRIATEHDRKGAAAGRVTSGHKRYGHLLFLGLSRNGLSAVCYLNFNRQQQNAEREGSDRDPRANTEIFHEADLHLSLCLLRHDQVRDRANEREVPGKGAAHGKGEPEGMAAAERLREWLQ